MLNLIKNLSNYEINELAENMVGQNPLFSFWFSFFGI